MKVKSLCHVLRRFPTNPVAAGSSSWFPTNPVAVAPIVTACTADRLRRYYAHVAGASNKSQGNLARVLDSMGNSSTAIVLDNSAEADKTSLAFAIALSLVISMAMQGLFNLRYVRWPRGALDRLDRCVDRLDKRCPLTSVLVPIAKHVAVHYQPCCFPLTNMFISMLLFVE
jgi:hypothetical protein